MGGGGKRRLEQQSQVEAGRRQRRESETFDIYKRERPEVARRGAEERGQVKGQLGSAYEGGYVDPEGKRRSRDIVQRGEERGYPSERRRPAGIWEGPQDITRKQLRPAHAIPSPSLGGMRGGEQALGDERGRVSTAALRPQFLGGGRGERRPVPGDRYFGEAADIYRGLPQDRTVQDYYGGAEDVYGGLAGGGIPGLDLGAVRQALPNLGGIADTGGISGVDLGGIREALPGYQQFGETGGFTSGGEAGIREAINELNRRSMDPLGGISEGGVERMRGGGGFERFADGGGYSEEDIANIRARATSPIASLYGRGLSELDRMRSVQGGYAPGFTGAKRQLMRDMSQQISDVGRATEADIAERRIAGERFGIGGMTASEQAAQGMIGGRQQAGLQGAIGGGLGLEQALQGGRLAGFGGVSDIGRTAAGMDLAQQQAALGGRLSAAGQISDIQRGAEGLNLAQQQATQRGMLGAGAGLAGIGGARTGRDESGFGRDIQAGSIAGGGLAGIGGQRQAGQLQRGGLGLQRRGLEQQRQENVAANRRFFSSLGIQNEQQLMNLMQRGQMFGTGGLQNLYGGAGSGEQRALDQLMMGGAGMFGQQGLQDIQNRIATQNIPSGWERAAGAAGGILGGVSGLPMFGRGGQVAGEG